MCFLIYRGLFKTIQQSLNFDTIDNTNNTIALNFSKKVLYFIFQLKIVINKEPCINLVLRIPRSKF